MEIERQLIADVLPAYDIGDVLGSGGWGVVLAGRHRTLDRRVAIKQLPRAFAADVALRRRFTAEARVLASLDHPHVVPVYDFVEREELCLLVMELLPGGTVRDRLTSTGFTAPQAVAVSLACAAGLTAAHERGVLHRDVKPENMLFAASGALKVTDFGIAKLVGGAETLVTRAGEVIGTPSYMAPEQARGGELSPATDVYGLATMLYELLSGVLPFSDEGDAMTLMFKHAYEAPIRLDEVADGLPEPVVTVVMRGLSTDPGDRFPTAESFGVALAGAGTRAWGPGWLSADGMPVLLGAERIVAPTRHPASVPHGFAPHPSPAGGHAPPGGPPAGSAPPGTASPDGPSAPGGSRRPAPVAARPGATSTARDDARSADGHVRAEDAAVTRAPGASSPATAEPEIRRTPAADGGSGPDGGTAAPARPRRRPLAIAVIVLAVLLAATAAVLLLPRLFTVY